MKAVDTAYLDELNKIADKVLEIAGGGDFRHLYVYFDELEVKDSDNRVVGHFVWSDHEECLAFRPDCMKK